MRLSRLFSAITVVTFMLANGLYMNFGCIILDCNIVNIGENLLCSAPNVQIYTAYHPTDPEIRLSGKELAAPHLYW